MSRPRNPIRLRCAECGRPLPPSRRNRRRCTRCSAAGPDPTPDARIPIRLAAVTSWRQQASCRGWPTEWWFPPRGGGSAAIYARARRICGDCPVRPSCLEEALADPSLDGIWAGVAPKERSRIRTARARRRQGMSDRLAVLVAAANGWEDTTL